MAISLNYEVLGTGKPIVILHGLLGAGRNLRALARKLSDTYSVFLLDLRNHGNSPHSASMSYPEMASDVASIVSDIDSGPVNIIGHSMGGKVAMACALENLFDIEKLIVLDIDHRTGRYVVNDDRPGCCVVNRGKMLQDAGLARPVVITHNVKGGIRTDFLRMPRKMNRLRRVV